MSAFHVPATLVNHLGWVLVHSVWQFALVALVALMLDRATRRSSAANRYWMLLLSLAAMVASPIVTLIVASVDRLNSAQAPVPESASLNVAPRTSAGGLVVEGAARPGPSNETRPRSAVDPAIVRDAGDGRLAPRTPAEDLSFVSWRSSAELAVRPWLSAIVGVWSLGVLAFAWRPLLSWRTLRRLRRVGIAAVPDGIATTLHGVARRIGLRQTVQVLQSTLVRVPVVVGYLRPVILLPVSIAGNLPVSQLEAILAHELAHVQRHDYLVNLLQTLVETIFFYHPAVWWLSRCIRVERENCCDDVAVALSENRVDYGRALLAIEEMRGGRSALALGSHGGSLLDRIQRVVGRQPARESIPSGSLGVLTALAALSIAFGAWAGLFASAGQSGERAGPIAVAQQPDENQWPQWGGSPSRNNVSTAGRLATAWDVGAGQNIKWTAALGDSSYGSPVIASSKVLIGTNNGAGRLARFPKTTDLACLQCFDERTGEFLWQYSSEKLPSGRAQDWPEIGLCSTPCVDGDRVWLSTNRGEVVCLDLNGFRDDQNDGPVTDEVAKNKHEADVIWRFDTIKQLGVSPQYQSCSSPTIVGDLVILNTGNGLDESHQRIPAPHAPSFLALDRHTGHVVWQDASPGENLLGGECPSTSPAVAELGGVTQAIFGGGDGWVYAFDVAEMQSGKTRLLWKFDVNPKTAKYQLSKGARNAILAAPVIHDGKVYITTGRNPENGEGPGLLWCVDPTKRGDISSELVFNKSNPEEPIAHKRLQACDPDAGDFTRPNPNSGVIWKYESSDLNENGTVEFEESMHRACGGASIHEGLLFVADFSGLVHCLDARTGKLHWTHDLFAATWSTPLIVDGKVYIGTEDGDVFVFGLSAKKELLATNPCEQRIHATPAAAHATLFVGSQQRLLAIGLPEAERDRQAAIDVSATGALAIDGKAVRLAKLDATLRAAGCEPASTTIVVRAARKAPYKVIAELLATLNGAGWARFALKPAERAQLIQGALQEFDAAFAATVDTAELERRKRLALSPDFSQLAFFRDGELFVLDVGVGEVAQVEQVGAEIEAIVWTKDGPLVLFSSGKVVNVKLVGRAERIKSVIYAPPADPPEETPKEYGVKDWAQWFINQVQYRRQKDGRYPAAAFKNLRKWTIDDLAGEPDAPGAAEARKWLLTTAPDGDWAETDFTSLVEQIGVWRLSVVQRALYDDELAAKSFPKPGRPPAAGELDGVRFGPAADNGLRVAWIFDPLKQEYAIGEALKCRVVFHNSGDQPVQFAARDLQDGVWTIRDAAGRPIQTDDVDYSRYWGTPLLMPCQRYRLEPGQLVEIPGKGIGVGQADYSAALTKMAIWRIVRVRAGDSVRIGVETDLDISLPIDEFPEEKARDWLGSLRSGEVAFNVVAAEANAAAPGAGKAFDPFQCVVVDAVTGEAISGNDLTIQFMFVIPAAGDAPQEVIDNLVWGPKSASTIEFIVPEKSLRHPDRDKIVVRWGVRHPEYETLSAKETVSLNHVLDDEPKSARDTFRRIALNPKKAQDARGGVERALRKKVSLSVSDQPLIFVLDQLERAHGVAVTISLKEVHAKGVDEHAKVTADMKDVSLREAFEHVLSKVGLAFDVTEAGIFIPAKDPPFGSNAPETPAIGVENHAADSLTICGLDVSGYPSTLDKGALPGFLEADPEKPGQKKWAANLLSMPIYKSDRYATLDYPVGSGHFFVSVREGQRTRTYGPIEGDPFDLLGLDKSMHELLREAVESPNDAMLRLRQLLSRGDVELRRRGLSMVQELPVPADRRTLDGLIEILERIGAQASDAPFKAEAETALARVRGLKAKAVASWESRRVLLDDAEYSAGNDSEPSSQIVWGKPHPASGLQVGFSLKPSEGSQVKPDRDGFQWPFGDPLMATVFVRAQGNAPVKFTSTSRADEGLRLWLVDEAGKRHDHGIGAFTSLLQEKRFRLAKGQWVELKGLILTATQQLADADEAHFHSGFLVPAGRFTLQVELTIAGFESGGTAGPITVPAAGEWTGELASGGVPVSLVVADASIEGDAAAAQPGDGAGPAKLIVKYDIPGSVENERIYVQHIEGRGDIGTEEQGLTKWNPLKNGETLELKDLEAGDYQVARYRQVEIDPSGVSRGLMVDRRRFKLQAKETKSIEFMRPSGKTVSGRVANVEVAGKGKVVVYACSENARDAESLSSLDVAIFDALNCDADGAFTTEPLSPGAYTILVEGYVPLTPDQLRQSGAIRPRFVGTAQVTVPESGEPPAVEVTLKDTQRAGGDKPKPVAPSGETRENVDPESEFPDDIQRIVQTLQGTWRLFSYYRHGKPEEAPKDEDLYAFNDRNFSQQRNGLEVGRGIFEVTSSADPARLMLRYTDKNGFTGGHLDAVFEFQPEGELWFSVADTDVRPTREALLTGQPRLVWKLRRVEKPPAPEGDKPEGPRSGQ